MHRKFKYELIDYMFDIPEKYQNNHHAMLSNHLLRVRDVRKELYDTDTKLLEDFCIVINIHADAALGTYLVHKDYVQEYFIGTDDFDLMFSIKEYNQLKYDLKFKQTKQYYLFEELDKFPDEKIEYRYLYAQGELEDSLREKTKWTITTLNDTPIAITSLYDSKRFCDCEFDGSEPEESKFKSFRVTNFQEGLNYLIEFRK